MRVQLAWTMLTEIVVTLSGLLLLKLAASMLGPAGFGEYAVSRRAVGLLYLPLVLGLGIAAPRYIAIARTRTVPEYDESSFAAATLTGGLIPPLFVILLLNVFPEWSAVLIFGTASLAHLVAPASIALAGLALHSITYAVYRGRSEMGFANLLQLVNVGLIPVGVFGLARHDAGAILTGTGIAWLAVSSLSLVHLLLREDRHWPRLGEHLRILLRFGIPRVPGEFALAGLFAIPALIAVRAHGIVEAGYFSAALSILTIVSGAFAPVGLVLLPRASAQAATGDIAGLRALVVKMLGAGILLAGIGVLIGELLIPSFVAWYFGDAFTPAIPIFRACLLGAVPYAIYVLMRNILDALDVKALNSRNLIIALFVAVTSCLIDSSLLWMSGSIVVALTILGALTLRDTFARLSPPASATGPVAV
jgi:O-antigen/teichoic acid export membrane protein